MKTIILAALLVLAISSKVEFSQDSNSESSIGVFTRGFFDPTASGEAKIETFLRLANELIPLAEVKADSSHPSGKKLGRTWLYCTGTVGSLFNACGYASAELWIGWAMNQNCTSSSGTYGVTFTPYTFLRAGGNVSVESYPAKVGYGAYLSVVDITIPIYFMINQQQFCYSGSFIFAPGQFYTQISTALLECAWYVTPPSAAMCSEVTGPNFQHLTYALWSGFTSSFLASNCFNF